MPAQDRGGSDDQPQPGQAPGRQRPSEQRQPRPVRPRQPRMNARPLTQGHRELMAQHQDLSVLPPRLPPRQAQHRHSTGHNEEDQLQAHKPKIIAPPTDQDLPARRPNAGLSRPRSADSICPVGFQNSATAIDLGFYAARSYSLMKPPRTGRRLIRSWKRSATGSRAGAGARWTPRSRRASPAHAAVVELAAAWRDPAAWEGMTEAGGLRMPADVMGAVALDQLVLHGWTSPARPANRLPAIRPARQPSLLSPARLRSRPGRAVRPGGR